MAVFKRGDVYWYEFIFAGKRVRESAKTASKTIAKEAEKSHRRSLERSLAGLPSEKREDRIKSVEDMVKFYLMHYGINHREKSVDFATGRLQHVKRLVGSVLLPDLTEDVIRGYIKTRLKEKVSGRTINMEVGEMSRAIGKPWSILWPKVRKLEERKDVGKALSPEEESRLLATITEQASPNRSQTLGTFVRVALLTGMRSSEILSLRWGQVDFERRIVTVGKAKSTAGTGRQIPMNSDLIGVLSAHADWFTDRFGESKPGHYLFPFGKPTPSDPTRPITDVTSAWDALRKRAGVNCRLHDLRHTAATKMAEAGVPESTMLALMGHMSRAMLERYSHVRLAAKREAVEALSIAPKPSKVESSKRVPTKVPTIGDNEKIYRA
jgi:integrase